MIRRRGTLACGILTCGTLMASVVPATPADAQTLDIPPLATIDLTTRPGVELVDGSWRYSDVEIVEVEFWRAGTDGQPGDVPTKTHDIRPRAGARDFDDSEWEVVPADELGRRRTGGRLGFAWYRIRVTVPETVGDLDPTGTTLVLEATVDDYSEVWVDGELSRAPGQSGGSVVAGWNRPNRLTIERNVKPGQQIQVAIFAINGPISASPTNYVFLRTARLEFHAGSWEPRAAVPPPEVNVDVVRLAPELDALVPRNPKLFKLADGFTFTEGPIWVGGADGHLLFSDPNENRIYRYDPDGRLRVLRKNSGYAGADVGRYRQPGSNGLTLDRSGRLTIAQHGDRRVVRLESDGALTVLADRYDGRRLNSPNDLVYRSDGSLYFTDPPFGLPETFDDPAREIEFSGVYRWRPEGLQLLVDDLVGPNGIAFSPDEKFLYVGNWDPEHKVVMRYPVRRNGSLDAGEVFADLGDRPEPEAIDGVKVDLEGNVYVSGPGGLWIYAADGRRLGAVIVPNPIHNMAWGGEGARSLFLTARGAVYRLPLEVSGVKP